jgi:hypothetical protein
MTTAADPLGSKELIQVADAVLTALSAVCWQALPCTRAAVLLKVCCLVHGYLRFHATHAISLSMERFDIWQTFHGLPDKSFADT